MAVGAENAALCNLCQDGLKSVASPLDHVGRMHNLSALGAVLGCRVDVVKLKSGRVSIKATLLASTLHLDTVGDGAAGFG